MKTKEQEIIETLESALVHADEWLKFIKKENNGEIPAFGWGFIAIEQALNELEEYKRQASLGTRLQGRPLDDNGKIEFRVRKNEEPNSR